MTPSNVSREITQARWMRNILFVLLVLSVTSNAALSVHMARQTNQVVLVPSVVSDGMVARGKIDVSYLEQLAKDVVSSLYQVTPSTLGEGRSVLERVASSGQRADILKQYDETAQDIKDRGLSTVWRHEKLSTDFDNLTVDITGQFETYVGTSFASEQKLTIRVRFGREGASARVIGIESLEN